MISRLRLWRPLESTTFRQLLAATAISDIGIFMRVTGTAWLMLSFGAGPMYVALIQTASSLPFFLLALPAGSIGDIVDRRKLILVTELWMMSASVALACMTIAGIISPWALILLTFAISVGDAFETPAWGAIVPEMVSDDDLVSASALSWMEYNLARVVGPALTGALIAGGAVGTVFVLDAVSFIGVILVIARWKRLPPKEVAPAETVGEAVTGALRYFRYSPAIRTLACKAGIVVFFTSAILALLPSVAQRVNESPVALSLMLGCFGAGGITGGLLLQVVPPRWSTESVASASAIILGLTIAGLAPSGTLMSAGALMVVGGSAWIVFISVLSGFVQNLAPEWVRARVLAIYILLFQGGMVAGSTLWGIIADRWSIGTALLCAGTGAIAATALGLIWKVPHASATLRLGKPWPMPLPLEEPGLRDGPVLITVEYRVEAEKSAEFLEIMGECERARRRDGAYRWGIFRDMSAPNRYVETFLVRSWAEHVRQHARQTVADHEIEKRVRSCVYSEPKVEHLMHGRQRPGKSGLRNPSGR